MEERLFLIVVFALIIPGYFLMKWLDAFLAVYFSDVKGRCFSDIHDKHDKKAIHRKHQ